MTARFRGSRSTLVALAFLVPGFAALAVELTRYWYASVPISGAVIGIAAVCLFVGGSILDPTKARMITGTAVTEGLRVLDGVMVFKRIGRRSTDPLVPVEPPAAAEVLDDAAVILSDDEVEGDENEGDPVDSVDTAQFIMPESAALGITEAQARKLVRRDLSECAPAFARAVSRALAECNANGHDVIVYEALRTDEVQQAYYALGRTVLPPNRTVTNARTVLGSWHGYGLAVDVISAAHGWKYPAGWLKAVSAIFKSHGLKWGGDWTTKDLPHFYWGKCRPSPSQQARDLYRNGGMRAVWKAVGAL